MDSQLEDYLNKILGSLSAIAQNQEKQRQDHINLAQQVESMQISINSQNDNHEETRSLTFLKSVYRPDVEEESKQTDPNWTSESHATSSPETRDQVHVPLSPVSRTMHDILTEVRQLLSQQTDSINSMLTDERYFLRDHLGNAQTEILERLGIFQQQFMSSPHRKGEKNPEADVSAPTGIGSFTLDEFRSVCNQLETSVRGVTRMELLWLDKEVKDKFSALENTVNCQMAGMDEKMMRLDKRLSEELDKKVLGLKQDILARTTEEMKEVKHVMNKTGEQIEKIQIVPDRSADIRTYTETVKGCQRMTEEHIQRSDKEIKKLQWCFGISVLLILCPLFLSFCLSPPGILCVEVVQDNQMKTEEAIQRSRDDLSTILNHQQRMDQKIEKKFNDLARLTEFQSHFTPLPDLYRGVNKSNICTEELTELRDVTAKIDAQFHKTQNVQNLTAEIRTYTETVKDCQKETKSSIEIFTLMGRYCCIFVLLIALILFIVGRESNQKTKELSSKIETQTVDLSSKIETKSKELSNKIETQSEELSSKIETQSEELSSNLYRSKIELFSYIEKESQLIRDRQRPPAGVGERKKYIFHLYVEQFKDLIRSGEAVKSYPWHVHQWKTSVHGKVWFKSYGDMEVFLVQGRKVRELGLEPRSDIKLKVTATVIDLSGTIENYRVGEKIWAYDENYMIHNLDYGRHIGDVSCQTLLDLGFASKENYINDAILIVYEIEVL